MFHTIPALFYKSQVKAFAHHLHCAFVSSSPRQNRGHAISNTARTPFAVFPPHEEKVSRSSRLPVCLSALANVLKASARHHLLQVWCQPASISSPQPSNLAHIPGTETHPSINPDWCLIESEIDFLFLGWSTHFGFHLTKAFSTWHRILWVLSGVAGLCTMHVSVPSQECFDEQWGCWCII